jgi:uncharacterized protein YegL
MYDSINDIKECLSKYIESIDNTVSIDIFNHTSSNIVSPTANKNIIKKAIESITTGGGTSLGHALENFYDSTLIEWGKIKPTIVIITDGATDDVGKSCKFFKEIKKNYNIILLGFGSSYEYDNCIQIVERDATIFEHVEKSDNLIPMLYNRIGIPLTKIKICTDIDNIIYTGAKKTHNHLFFVEQGTSIKLAVTNGLPQIYIDDVKIIPIEDSDLNAESALFEFICVYLINNIGSEINCTNALRMKLKLNSLEKYIREKISDILLLNRLLDFIQSIKIICEQEFKQSNEFGIGMNCLSRGTSNEVHRAVSEGLKECYRSR